MSKIDFVKMQVAEKQRLHILSALIAVAKKANRVSHVCVSGSEEV